MLRETGGTTKFHIDYHLFGLKGIEVEREFYHEGDTFISETVPTMWSSCGGSNIFEINSSLYAQKVNSDYVDSFIKINSSDSISLVYHFDERSCHDFYGLSSMDIK